MKVRRRVYELSLDDLDRFPVWEYALDEEGEEGQDEATVRPLDGAGPVDPAEGGRIVSVPDTLRASAARVRCSLKSTPAPNR